MLKLNGIVYPYVSRTRTNACCRLCVVHWDGEPHIVYFSPGTEKELYDYLSNAFDCGNVGEITLWSNHGLQQYTTLPNMLSHHPI